MPDFFSASDIVEFAVEIEKNGKDFYETLAADSKDEKLKETFRSLANAEGQHAQVFSKILERLGPFNPKEAFNDEYFAYMKSIADEHVFTKALNGHEIAKSITTNDKAIAMAIAIEKDSIAFYNQMKKVVNKNEHLIINEIIANEYQHLKTLEDLIEPKERKNE